jgi:hypothetical protein
MSTGKHLSTPDVSGARGNGGSGGSGGSGGLTNADPRRGAHRTSEDDWFEPDSDTRIDARIEDRSDWARPRDPSAVDHIARMLEEVLVAVPLSPIEDHRASNDDSALGTPEPSPAPAARALSARFVLAGILGSTFAILIAAWLLI